MMQPSNRRGFLRGLCSLPLIGGGVTLIGAPTAAAVPVTEALMSRYAAWLSRERAEVMVALEGIRWADCPYVEHRMADRREWADQFWFADGPVARKNVLGASPSTRAALVLSAAGCELPAVRP